MAGLNTVFLQDSSRSDSEDHVDARLLDDRVVLALADGAGGSSNGGSAAQLAVRTILKQKPSLDPTEWVLCLAEIDRQLSEGGNAGETTAVAVVITAEIIVGASVGDSGALFIGDGACVDLTERQERKPLLGTGVAVPRMFQHGRGEGTLLVASDGLLKYTSRDKIAETLRRVSLDAAPKALIDLVRLRSGVLQDDVAVALCRRRLVEVGATRDS